MGVTAATFDVWTVVGNKVTKAVHENATMRSNVKMRTRRESSQHFL